LGLNRAAFEKRVAAGERVLIDTSVLLAYFEGSADATHPVAAHLIDAMIVGDGRNAGVVSMVTAMEVLVRPLRTAPAAALHVHDFLTHTPNVSLQPVDLHVAQEGASLRATHRFKTPDALVIATGVVSQVHHLVTNDADWESKLAPIKDRIRVTLLKNYL
jgi:predicted nucleic acid-binding protein